MAARIHGSAGLLLAKKPHSAKAAVRAEKSRRAATSVRDAGADDVLQPAIPRHIDLARELLQEVRDGIYPVGGHLPTEAELCTRYGLSRYAVRQAVQKLCDLGIVAPRAGIGTRVVSDRPQAKYTQIMDTLADLPRYARGTVLQVLTRRDLKIDSALSAQLDLPAGSSWVHLHGIRFSDESARQAITSVDIYVASEFRRASVVRGPADVPVHMMIEKKYGVRATRVEQEIQGTLIEGETAAALQVADGSAGLRIIRSYFVDERLIERTIGVHPAGRFSYSMTFKLTPG